VNDDNKHEFHYCGVIFVADISVLHRKEIRITYNILSCGAGKGWWRSYAQVMWEKMKCYTESRIKGISCVRYKEGKLTVLVTSCVGIAF